MLKTQEFERRIERLRPLLTQRARTGGLGIEDAEDVVCEAIGKAWAAIERYDDGRGEAGFCAWMQTITDRCALDLQVKRHRNGGEESLHESMEGAARGVGEDSESLDWLEMRHELRVRLRTACLTERQRRAIDGWLAGQRQAGIAMDMSISQQAVGQHLAAGIARLRVSLPPSDTLPDNLQWLVRIMTDAVIYRAPLTTGSGLSRERTGRLK